MVRLGNICMEQINKKGFKKFIFRNPELLKDLIQQYKAKPKEEYDFKNDPLEICIWDKCLKRTNRISFKSTPIIATY